MHNKMADAKPTMLMIALGTNVLNVPARDRLEVP